MRVDGPSSFRGAIVIGLLDITISSDMDKFPNRQQGIDLQQESEHLNQPNSSVETIKLRSGEQGLREEGLVRTSPEDFASAGLANIKKGDRVTVDLPGGAMLAEIAGVGPEVPWNPKNKYDVERAQSGQLNYAALWMYPLSDKGEQMGAVFIRSSDFNRIKSTQEK